MNRLARQILLLALPLMLTACGPEAGLVMAGTTLASYSLTGKNGFDNAMSEASGKDCDIGKMRDNNGHYCTANKIKDDPVFAHIDRPSVYCFHTMGEVECHCSADPYSNNNTPYVKGRGEFAGESCMNRQQTSLPSEPIETVDAASKYGQEIPPPPLPPQAYEDIVKPAATPFGPGTPPPGSKQNEPLELAPEHAGS